MAPRSFCRFRVRAGEWASARVCAWGEEAAFLDSRESFAEDAPPALDVMLDFLDSVFYPEGE